MTTHYLPTLRQRLIDRHSRPGEPELLGIPATGEIEAEDVASIQQLATLAKAGDIPARDRLYFSLQSRLHRIGYVLRPWPNTPDITGLWDRDDVHQESWLICVELLAAWDGETPFVNYLLARFSWRLRDRILRGIGKPLPAIGTIRVPEDILTEVLTASDSDQPESAVMASNLLEHLLNQRLNGSAATADAREVLTALQSPRRRGELESLSVPDDDQHLPKRGVA